MELNEQDLETVLGGAQKEVVEDNINKHPELYRNDKVAELKQLKEKLLRVKANLNEEMTESELEEIQAGRGGR